MAIFKFVSITCYTRSYRVQTIKCNRCFFHYAFVNIISSDSNPFHLEEVNTHPHLPLAFNTGLQAQGIYSSFYQLGSVPPCVCFSGGV